MIRFRKYDDATGIEYAGPITTGELPSGISHTHALNSPDGSIEHDIEITSDVVFHLSARIASAYVLTTTNIANITTITGPGTYDGVSVPAGAMIAAAGQTTAGENDFWIVGATGQTWTRAQLVPRVGMRVHVVNGTFANREFVVQSASARTAVAMVLRRIDGALMCRAGSDANISIIATRTNELMLPRLYVGIPQLTAIRTYTLPSVASGLLIDGTEIIMQFETNAPNAQVSIAQGATGENINGATTYTFTTSAWRRVHLIFRNGLWFANQFA